jgi:hypothetical protein
MRIRIATVSSVLVLVGAAPAFAQLGIGQGIDPITHGIPQPPAKAQPKTVAPPALPGAASSSAPAPAVHSSTDMEPTDALFDAINRGDIAGARDAISRGADLNGRNVLGMTPMELSVDLGRNDISFLLLSMRNGDGGGNRQPLPAQTAAKPVPTRQARQETRRSAPAPAVKVAAPVQPQNPRLFAGDGGAPIPNAGFLGFDSGRH